MISWIQHHLIKNGKWIFSILLVVIIVAFVFVIGNTPGLPGREMGLDGVEYYGVNLNSREQMEQLDREAALSAYLNTGNAQMQGNQVRQIGLARLALLHLADSHAIPDPTAEEVKQFLRDRPIFMGQDGQFDPDAYQRFLDLMTGNPAYPPQLLDKILRDELRVQRMNTLLSGETGYVTPYEVYRQAQRDGTEWVLKVANFDYRAFDPEIMTTEEKLQEYFENNKFNYEIPERQVLRWVYFPAEPFVEAIEAPKDEVLIDYIERNISKYMDPIDESDPAASIPGPEELLEQKRDTVLADWRLAQAKDRAEQTAADFAYSFYEDQVDQDETAVEAAAADAGAQTGRFLPVSRQSNPREVGDGATWQILQATRGLNSTQWFSDAMPFREGFGVFFLVGELDPELPAYADVRDQVLADFRAAEKRRLFNETGALIAEHIRQELEAGKSFEEAVRTSALSPQAEDILRDMENAFESDVSLTDLAEKAELDIREYAFTANDTPSGLSVSVFRAVQDLDPGQVSDMVTISGTGGFFAYVEDKQVPQPDPDSDLYATARENLGFNSMNLFTSNAVSELVNSAIPAEDVR